MYSEPIANPTGVAQMLLFSIFIYTVAIAAKPLYLESTVSELCHAHIHVLLCASLLDHALYYMYKGTDGKQCTIMQINIELVVAMEIIEFLSRNTNKNLLFKVMFSGLRIVYDQSGS